ncbi:MAG: hypothetical protein ABTQ25_04515 [Nitrosomonas ureae]
MRPRLLRVFNHHATLWRAVNQWVELHFNNVRSALFQAIEPKAGEVDQEVIRIDGKALTQFFDGNCGAIRHVRILIVERTEKLANVEVEATGAARRDRSPPT